MAFVNLSGWSIKSVSESVPESFFWLFCRAFATERSDLGIAMHCIGVICCAELRNQTMCKVDLMPNYGRDEIDLAGLTVKDTVSGEILEEAVCWSDK